MFLAEIGTAGVISAYFFRHFTSGYSLNVSDPNEGQPVQLSDYLFVFGCGLVFWLSVLLRAKLHGSGDRQADIRKVAKLAILITPITTLNLCGGLLAPFMKLPLLVRFLLLFHVSSNLALLLIWAFLSLKECMILLDAHTQQQQKSSPEPRANSCPDRLQKSRGRYDLYFPYRGQIKRIKPPTIFPKKVVKSPTVAVSDLSNSQVSAIQVASANNSFFCQNLYEAGGSGSSASKSNFYQKPYEAGGSGSGHGSGASGREENRGRYGGNDGGGGTGGGGDRGESGSGHGSGASGSGENSGEYGGHGRDKGGTGSGHGSGASGSGENSGGYGGHGQDEGGTGSGHGSGASGSGENGGGYGGHGQDKGGTGSGHGSGASGSGGDPESGERETNAEQAFKSSKITEMSLMLTAQTTATLIGYHLIPTPSSSSKALLVVALMDQLVGYLCGVTSILLSSNKPEDSKAAKIFADIGFGCSTLGFILMIAMYVAWYLVLIVVLLFGVVWVIFFRNGLKTRGTEVWNYLKNARNQ